MVSPPLSFRRPAFFGVAGPFFAVIVALAGDAAAQTAPPPAALPPSEQRRGERDASRRPRSGGACPARVHARVPRADGSSRSGVRARRAGVGPGFGQPAWPAYTPAYPASPTFYQQQEPFSLPPPVPKEAAHRKLMITGIVAASTGVATLITGSILMSIATNRIDVYRDGPAYCCSIDDAPLRNAGIAMLVAGGITATLGVPLWMIGGRRVPVRGATDKPDASPQVKTPALRAPLLRVGATGASVSWQF